MICRLKNVIVLDGRKQKLFQLVYHLEILVNVSICWVRATLVSPSSDRYFNAIFIPLLYFHIIYILESHISHLRTKSEQELNRLLSMVVDFDNMRIAMNREENLDTRKPYSYLLKVANVLKH